MPLKIKEIKNQGKFVYIVFDSDGSDNECAIGFVPALTGHFWIPGKSNEYKMKEEELTITDLELITESLNETIRSFKNYEHYPSYEFKCERIAEAKAVKSKVTAMKKRIKAGQ